MYDPPEYKMFAPMFHKKKKRWVWFGSWFLITELPGWYFWHLFLWEQSSSPGLSAPIVRFLLDVFLLGVEEVTITHFELWGNLLMRASVDVLLLEWPSLVLFWTKIALPLCVFYFRWVCSFINHSSASLWDHFVSDSSWRRHILWSSDVFLHFLCRHHLTLLAHGYIVIFLHHFATICVTLLVSPLQLVNCF